MFETILLKELLCCFLLNFLGMIKNDKRNNVPNAAGIYSIKHVRFRM